MSDASYMRILKQLEELYPMASGEVLRAAARCEMRYPQASGDLARAPARCDTLASTSLAHNTGHVIDIRTHAATLRRARQ